MNVEEIRLEDIQPSNVNQICVILLEVLFLESISEIRAEELPSNIQGADMAKYTATISEDLRQRIHALPRSTHFSDFMKKAITVFVEELEQNPELSPENFIITVTARKDTSNGKR